MQLKHGTLEFAIPVEPATLELWLGRGSWRHRFGGSGEQLGEGVAGGGVGGDIKGEEIDGGGGGRGALGRFEGNLVAENGDGFEVVGKWRDLNNSWLMN